MLFSLAWVVPDSTYSILEKWLLLSVQKTIYKEEMHMWKTIVAEIIDLLISSPLQHVSNSQGCDRISCC